MEIKHQVTKTLDVRDNGRSSDAIAPNFIYGCLGGCMKSYCYVGRYNNDKVYVNDNVDQILASITKWSSLKPWDKIPNQVDDKSYVIEIGNSTDIPLHLKYYDWQKVFEYFNYGGGHNLKSTFATKYPSKMVENLKSDKPLKIYRTRNRIRISLMPQKYSDVLEPNTDSIATRIESIPFLQEYFEVHLNFSPIVYEDGWLEEYAKLFEQLTSFDFKSECIFLTYNETSFRNNSQDVNRLCWKPNIQEPKDSEYADGNIRYKWQLKKLMINDFKNLYSRYFDISTIRYIF